MQLSSFGRADAPLPHLPSTGLTVYKHPIDSAARIQSHLSIVFDDHGQVVREFFSPGIVILFRVFGVLASVICWRVNLHFGLLGDDLSTSVPAGAGGEVSRRYQWLRVCL